MHLLLCFADHYEPKQGRPAAEVSRARVGRWVRDYPRQFGRFRDSDGRTPRHSFFYPIEEYEPEYLDALAGLCRAGFGEVEVHLHHNRDTADNLRATLQGFKELLARRHGLLSRRRANGELAYGFIHGNWALCNSRPDGRWCGVDNELAILRETGCYADFTLPSAPHPTQTRRINSIYYARDLPGRPRSHDDGVPVGAGRGRRRPDAHSGAAAARTGGNRKYGLLPRLENACLQGSQPPTADRIDMWLRARVQVPTRPDWYFVKLHTHGAAEDQHEALLGEPMVRFHEAATRLAHTCTRENARYFHFHYVHGPQEMYNTGHATRAGWHGAVADACSTSSWSPAPRSFRPSRGGGRSHVSTPCERWL